MLAKDREIWNRIRKLGLSVCLGPRGGVIPFKSLVRFLAQKGEQSGQRSRGRLSDYLFVLSEIKDRSVYRRREIAPLRKIQLVVDVRDFQESSSRLVQAAKIFGGVVLSMPSTQLILSAWGTKQHYLPRSFQGAGQWSFLNSTVEAMVQVGCDPYASKGALRRACTSDDSTYVVLISNWIEAEMLQFLDFPFGGACVIVPPSLGILGRFTTGLSSSLPGDITADRDQEAIEHVREICTGRRLDLVRLGTGKVIDEVENCLGKKTS